MKHVLRSILAVVFAVVAFAASHAQAPAADNTLTPAEQKAGWRLLFDGKSMDQWRGYKMEATPPGWTVEDGTLVTSPARGTRDIITKEQFSDFEFSWDWQISQRGNSGVMFYVVEAGDATYFSGPEYQLLHNAGHGDGKNPLTSAGACYALYPPSKDATRPVGEWNQSRIVINKGRGEHWLNGEKVVEYDMNSADWAAKVEGSKFSSKFPEMKDFGKARRGHIALQEHGARVAFKNLKIRPLN